METKELKIHCLEMRKETFNEIPMEEIRKMVGWIDVPNSKDDTWDVNLSDEGIFCCSTQENAQILAGIEELKAMFMIMINAREKKNNE